jgi:hypothetical protein
VKICSFLKKYVFQEVLQNDSMVEISFCIIFQCINIRAKLWYVLVIIDHSDFYQKKYC